MFPKFEKWYEIRENWNSHRCKLNFLLCNLYNFLSSDWVHEPKTITSTSGKRRWWRWWWRDFKTQTGFTRMESSWGQVCWCFQKNPLCGFHVSQHLCILCIGVRGCIVNAAGLLNNYIGKHIEWQGRYLRVWFERGVVTHLENWPVTYFYLLPWNVAANISECWIIEISNHVSGWGLWLLKYIQSRGKRQSEKMTRWMLAKKWPRKRYHRTLGLIYDNKFISRLRLFISKYRWI